MKKNFLVIVLIVFACSFSTMTFAQGGLTTTQTVTMTVSGKALIEVIGGPVGLSLSGASQAGADPTQDFGRDATTRLRMSSLTSGTDTRTITAAITQVDAAAGTNATLRAKNSRLHLRLLPPADATAQGHFVNYNESNLSNGTSPIENVSQLLPAFDLTNAASITLASGISTTWTGTADNDGYVIEYVYTATGTGAPIPGSTQVTFTISGN